jgi:hypothetical protein
MLLDRVQRFKAAPGRMARSTTSADDPPLEFPSEFPFEPDFEISLEVSRNR